MMWLIGLILILSACGSPPESQAGTYRVNLNAYDRMVIPENNGQNVPLATKTRVYPTRDWFGQLAIFLNTGGNSMLMVRATEPDTQYIQNWNIVNNDNNAPCVNTQWCLAITFRSPSDPQVIETTYSNTNDWRIAASDYKAWAQSQTWYRAHGRLKASELSHIIFGATTAYSFYQSNLQAATTSLQNPKKVGVYITQYRTSAFDVNYPDYTCSGAANCPAWFQNLKNTGYGFMLPYLNGILWDTTHVGYNASNMCLDSGGSPIVYTGNLRYVDPLLSSWPTTLRTAFNALQATDGSQSDGVYLDVIGATAQVCYYAGTPSYTAWITGEKTVYNAFSDKIIMSEGSGEVFFPYIDIVYTFPSNTNLSTEIGLFGYLYRDVPNLSIVGTDRSGGADCRESVHRAISQYLHTASLFESGFNCDESIPVDTRLRDMIRYWSVSPPAVTRTTASARTAAPATFYKTDNAIYVEPSLPSLPVAGSSITDPTFRTPITRLTDSNDSATDCMTVYSNAPSFNVNSTKVAALCTSGFQRFKVWDWDKSTNTRSNGRINTNLVSGIQEYGAQWSRVTPNKFYTCAERNLYEVTIPDGASTSWTNTLVKDLSGAIGGAGTDYCEQVSISNDDDVFAMHYNVSGTNTGYLVYRRSTDQILLNVNTDGTINEVEIDKSGKYLVVLTPTPTTYVWDLTGTPRKTTVTNEAFNHRAMGYGVVVSGCSSSRLCKRSLSDPNTVTMILNSGWSYAVQQDHFSLVGNSDDWMLSCRYDINAGGISNPYDNECLQVATDGSGKVRRFVHHRSRDYASDYDSAPKSNLSMDGRYFVFTSNWNGADASARNDVYIADMQGVLARPRPVRN